MLRCQGLVKTFGGVRGLDGVTLEFGAGGIKAVVGPNGAGKSTLLNVLTGFLKPEAGQCYLGARETTHLPAHRIARLGVARTFQDLRLVRHISVLDNVMLARPRQRGERLLGSLLRVGVAREETRNREEAARLLETAGLERERYRLAGELSYGQQKLLTLACCLATGAHILLLDEPVAGVSASMLSRVLDLLLKLRGEGRLIVFIEHDLAAVRQVADELIVMSAGKIAARGTPREVLESLQFTETYLA
jgi:ABC-type branched-subunit amino acid transport system ATPase component